MGIRSSTFARLNRTVAQGACVPGAIFLAMVSYPLGDPIPFLFRADYDGKDREKLLTPTEKASVVTGLDNIDKNFRQSGVVKDGLNTSGRIYEVVNGAKIRPLLILRGFEYYDVRFHNYYVLGLPFTSVKQRMKESSRYFRRLKNQETGLFYYVDAAKAPATQLRYESLVVICKPYLLLRNTLMKLIGHMHPEDMAVIVRQTKEFLDGHDPYPQNG